MGKKRSWFAFVTRLFISKAKTDSIEKSKRWRWMFERFKFRQRNEILAPEKALSEATEEQRKHILAAAIATAAAAEAAVAAANAAAEVFWLTQAPSALGKQSRNLAAIRIQSAFRGHLASKALKALKGLVKLQAVIRGEIARRSMMTKFKFIKSTAMACSRVYKLRDATVDLKCNASEKRQIIMPKETMRFQEMELECNKHRNWDISLVPKEDLDTLWVRKQESINKRERMKKCSFSHCERRNEQTLQIAEVEIGRKLATGKFNSFLHSKIIAEDVNHFVRTKLRNACEQDPLGGLDSQFSRPRRSFGDVKQKSIEEYSSRSLPNSPTFPTYMAATQSAKAKTRPISTLKQRLSLPDSYSSKHSPRKLKLSSSSSFHGEKTSFERKTGIL